MKTPTTPRAPKQPKPLTFGAEDVLLPESGKYAGLHPTDAEQVPLHGFVYRVLIRFPSGNFKDESYVGSKAFAKGKRWQTYTTSSDIVSPKIERNQQLGGLDIQYEILAYAVNAGQLKEIENSYILANKKQYGSRCLNKADARGGKIKPNANKYSKRKMQEPFGGRNIVECG